MDEEKRKFSNTEKTDCTDKIFMTYAKFTLINRGMRKAIAKNRNMAVQSLKFLTRLTQFSVGATRQGLSGLVSQRKGFPGAGRPFLAKKALMDVGGSPPTA